MPKRVRFDTSAGLRAPPPHRNPAPMCMAPGCTRFGIFGVRKPGFDALREPMSLWLCGEHMRERRAFRERAGYDG
jgi:hypothetical protein